MRGGQCSIVVAGSVPPQKTQNGLSFNKDCFDFFRWDASPMPSVPSSEKLEREYEMSNPSVAPRGRRGQHHRGDAANALRAALV
jgi:hypothetical protein